MPDNLYVNESNLASSEQTPVADDAAGDVQQEQDAAVAGGLPTPPIQMATAEPGVFQQVGFSQSGGPE